jgi:hypothetical protein
MYYVLCIMYYASMYYVLCIMYYASMYYVLCIMYYASIMHAGLAAYDIIDKASNNLTVKH